MKNNWKKTWKIALALLGMLVVLGGCGQKADDAVMRIGGLKGPTSMGLVFLTDAHAEDTQYEFTMTTQADELAAMVVRGDVDIALLPANLAAVLYQKTQEGIAVLDINTLGVLYMVSGNDKWQDMTVADLEGETIYLTGMGTTPDYALQTLLNQNGVKASLEYCAEASEVAAVLAENPEAIGLLPQPFVTSALMQNDTLHVVMDLDEQWEKTLGYRMVTGVTIVRKEFLEQHPTLVSRFVEEHEESTQKVQDQVEEAAKLVVEAGILPKEAVAKKAIPECNIVCLSGEGMPQMLQPYLEALYALDPKAVGGALPGEAFYQK